MKKGWRTEFRNCKSPERAVGRPITMMNDELGMSESQETGDRRPETDKP